jgi:hypothetical protein
MMFTPFRKVFGLRHISPVAVAYYCAFSEKGNFGRKIVTPNATFEVKELNNANLEVLHA